MRSGSLSSRLNRMKSTGEIPGAPKGSMQERRVLDVAGWERAGEFTYISESRFSRLLPERIDSLLLGREVATSQLLFFDLETTGLSTGAGSIFFLFGVGRQRGDAFLVRRVFLADFPGEAEFLSRVREEIPDGAVLVSYNGASFDLPLLRARFALKGLDLPEHSHLDLLHHARRMWKSTIGGCRLSDIETAVLGVAREDDVPGFEIPDRYFSFLKHGEAEGLLSVFTHHERDIVTLQSLFARCEADLSDPPEAGIDLHRVGVWLTGRSAGRGIALLRAAFDRGSVAAGLDLATALRRAGEVDCAVAVWSRLWEEHRSLLGGVALAKHYEHSLGELEAAKSLVDELMSDRRSAVASPGSEASRPRLRHRRDRLIRKIDRRLRRDE